MNFLTQLDRGLFYYFYHLVDDGFVPKVAVVFFAAYWQYVLVLILVYIFYRNRNDFNKKMMVILGVVSAVFARVVVKSGILLFIERQRPFVATAEEVDALIEVSRGEYLQSFPSGHAVFFFALAMVIWNFDRKLGKWFFLAASLMGVARVMAGVHWPGDIIAGAVIGVMVGKGFVVVYKKYKNKIDDLALKVLTKLNL